VDRVFQAKQDDNPPELNSEVHDHVRQLRRKMDDLVDLVTSPEPPTNLDIPSTEIRWFIRTILKLRASRRDMFGADLFGEASWDMLLELYDAEFSGRRVSVSSLCLASGVAQTTALRWVHVLEREGQIRRAPDGRDGRRCFVELTDQARAALDRIFAALRLPRSGG
jgi:DNA-binding MarR family transcriptional regulator